MARRLGFPLRQLQNEMPAFCDDDPRLLVKDGDEWNISVRFHGRSETDVMLDIRNTRQLRALARQLELLAERFEQRDASLEEVP